MLKRTAADLAEKDREIRHERSNVEVTGAARFYRAASGGPQGYASFLCSCGAQNDKFFNKDAIHRAVLEVRARNSLWASTDQKLQCL